MVQLKIFALMLPVAIIFYALALKYLGVKLNTSNILILIIGYVGLSIFFDAAITNNDNKAVIFFLILIVAIMIAGLFIGYGMKHAPQALTMAFCGYLLLFGAPLFGLLGSYKITRLPDNSPNLYEYHIRTDNEFAELKNKYTISPFLYLFMISFFVYAGYISVNLLSKNFAIFGVVISLVLIIMLSIRLGGFHNYLVSYANLWNNVHDFSDFTGKEDDK